MMGRRMILSFPLAILVLASPLSARSLAQPPAQMAKMEPVALQKQTGIDYFSSQQVVDYRPDGDRGLYVRGNNGTWYYATTANSCPRLQTADTIGFETGPGGRLDRHSTLYAQGWRCPLNSLVVSQAPPDKPKRRR